MKSRVIVAAIIENDGKILLGRKPENIGPYPNTWHLPGGGVNLGEESVEEAIRREIKEETGLEITDLEKVGFDDDYEKDKHGEITHYVFMVFRVGARSKDVVSGDDINKLKWFSKSEIKQIPLARPSIKLFKELGLL